MVRGPNPKRARPMSDPFERIADEWDREDQTKKVYDFDEERFFRAIEEQARKNYPEQNGHATDDLPLIKSSGEFVAGFVPPDYLADGLIQEAFLYSLTGATGAGKTA